jgi:DNA-directed RNA polymerase specialized sigma24 family protein
MKDLSPRDFKILFLRFWGKQSLSEIANDMRLNFEEVDSSIKSSLKLLKNLCLKDSLFSRFQDNFLKVANQ